MIQSQGGMFVLPTQGTELADKEYEQILGSHIAICNIFLLTHVTTEVQDKPNDFLPQPPSCEESFPPPPSRAASFEYILLE